MKGKRKLWPLLVATLLVAILAIASAWSRAGGSDTLNAGGPVADMAPGPPAVELKRLALELKGTFYNPERKGMDYEAAGKSAEYAHFARVARRLRDFDLQSLKSRAEKLAFWINLYNALTVHAILAFKPQQSVWEVRGFFNRAAYEVGGHRFSLNEIENGILRANRPGPYAFLRPFSRNDPRGQFALTEAEFDPRIHFALNCGSRSCPPIAFYEATQLDRQLDRAAKAFIRGETRLDGEAMVTSSIFKWYRRDFGDDLTAFLAKYLGEELATRARGKPVRFAPYDWSLH